MGEQRERRREGGRGRSKGRWEGLDRKNLQGGRLTLAARHNCLRLPVSYTIRWRRRPENDIVAGDRSLLLLLPPPHTQTYLRLKPNLSLFSFLSHWPGAGRAILLGLTLPLTVRTMDEDFGEVENVLVDVCLEAEEFAAC